MSTVIYLEKKKWNEMELGGGFDGNYFNDCLEAEDNGEDDSEEGVKTLSLIAQLDKFEEMCAENLRNDLLTAKKYHDLALQGCILKIVELVREEFNNKGIGLTDWAALGIATATYRAAIRVVEEKMS